MSIVRTGDTLSDRYQLKSEVGRGGMGTVFRAHDPLLERDVAVKVLSALALGTEGRKRLLHEAQAIAKLNHPNIVAVHDVGEIDETPYIVMELVEGADLHQEPPEDFAKIAAIVRQVCQALQHAHEHGIIHRDLKPENVLVQPDGQAKLVDFSIARSVASRMTTEGQIAGTVYYLAPELALRQEIDPRADLYSLGVMLYELVVGALPFSHEDPLAVISQHIHASPTLPRDKNPEIPPKLEHLILQLLQKGPEDRPSSAAAVLEELDHPQFLDPEAETDRELAVLARIARGRFVGRERELKQARSFWMRAMEGEGQTLLISGEPGIGKTRLMRELMTRAEIAGGKTLVGECYAESGAPYAPFSPILRRAVRWMSENGSRLPDFVLADLLTLTPELRPYYPDIPENPALDPESEQRRLFESVVTLCSNLSTEAPLFIVLEDVHWADSGSLALLRHLARRTKQLPVMLVATYREVELDAARPLNDLLSALNRERLGDRLKLGRFGRKETHKLLAAIFEEEVSDEFLEGIYQETEGNPFFTEELCKALVEEGRIYFENGEWHRPEMEDLELPQSVRVAIQSRLRKLPEQAQDTLRLAAILGHEFDFDTLRAASELEEGPLIDALETAERAQLIDEVSGERGGTFKFAHALIASTLVDGLTGLRRRRMHHGAAVAIEGLRPDDFETLAHHFSESGDMRRGLEYSRRAGERALRFSAYDEAMRHFSRALEIAEAEGIGEDLVTILEAIGDVQSVADFNQSLEAFERALQLSPEPAKRAELRAKIGRLHALTGDERGLPLLQEAIDTLNPDKQGNLLAQAIASIGRIHHNRGQHRQALEQLQRAHAIAEPLGDVSTLIYVYTFLAGSYQHLADFERSNEWAHREIEEGTRAQYPFMAAVGYEYLCENHNFMGRWEEARQYADEDRVLGEQNGLIERVRWAKMGLLWSLHGLGELDRAIDEGRQSLQMAEEGGDARLAVLAGRQLAIGLADRGDLAAALPLAEQAVQRAIELDQAYMICESLDALAYIHRLNGDWERALECKQQCAEAAQTSDNRLIPLIHGPGYAEALLETGQTQLASEVVEESLGIAVESESPIPQARALRVRAKIHASNGEPEEALADLAQAAEMCKSWNSRIDLGRILLDKVRLHVSQDAADLAEADARRALEVFEACSAGYWTEEVRAAMREIASSEA